MNTDRIAIVTPSFERDFELCRTLNRSVLEFLPSNVRHYIVVDRCDFRRFSALAHERTVVMRKEEILPRGIFRLPRSNRWFSGAAIFPIHGWLVQQIAKIAAAGVLSEPTLVMVDSDAVFVRDVDPGVFAREGASRLYVQRGGIAAGMDAHFAWHRNACSLLGISCESVPLDDYIGQVISWNRETVLRMCERIERVTGRRWHDAVARARAFSEYLTYGAFVERVAGLPGRAWIDEDARCNSHWSTAELTAADVESFVGRLRRDDIAMMINTHSPTTLATRARAIALATNGRLCAENDFLFAS